MARPIKHNADYFSHDNDMRNDIKIKALRRTFSHKGYSIFCMLLELLANSDYFEYEWNDMSIELLTPDFDIDADELREIVKYAMKLNLLQITNGYLHCDKLTDRLEEDVLKRRKGYCRENSKRSQLMLQKPIINGVNVYINDDIDNNNQERKVKEIKGNKIKVNEIEVKQSEENKMMDDYYDEAYNEILNEQVELEKYYETKAYREDLCSEAFTSSFKNNHSEYRNTDISIAMKHLNKLSEYMDDNNMPAVKALLSSIIEDYESFDNILQLCYGDDQRVLNNWRNYFNNTLQFIN